MSHKSWAQFMLWAQKVNHPEIIVEEDFVNDGIKICNKTTKTISFIPKYSIENLSQENAEKLIIEAVMNTYKGVTSGVYNPGTPKIGRAHV